MTTHEDVRLAKAKERAAKPKKSKFRVAKNAAVADVAIEAAVEPETQVVTPVEAPATPVEPKKKRAPRGEGAKKKASPTVTAWRGLMSEKSHTSGTITVLKPWVDTNHPKRGAANDRYKLYQTGMTVAEYIDASHKAGNSKGLAQADVRWDVAKGLISVS